MNRKKMSASRCFGFGIDFEIWNLHHKVSSKIDAVNLLAANFLTVDEVNFLSTKS